jgi:hypothetical protein
MSNIQYDSSYSLLGQSNTPVHGVASQLPGCSCAWADLFQLLLVATLHITVGTHSKSTRGPAVLSRLPVQQLRL